MYGDTHRLKPQIADSTSFRRNEEREDRINFDCLTSVFSLPISDIINKGWVEKTRQFSEDQSEELPDRMSYKNIGFRLICEAQSSFLPELAGGISVERAREDSRSVPAMPQYQKSKKGQMILLIVSTGSFRS